MGHTQPSRRAVRARARRTRTVLVTAAAGAGLLAAATAGAALAAGSDTGTAAGAATPPPAQTADARPSDAADTADERRRRAQVWEEAAQDAVRPLSGTATEPRQEQQEEEPAEDAADSGGGTSGLTPTGEGGACEASMYSEPQPTASGEQFDPSAMTAAHKTLPMDTMVQVTNPANGKSVTVRINDRGPYIEGRCLDLSTASFEQIASASAGVVDVEWQVVG
ncbi:septal ring lytic transglycosylase RlpA family protein [Streptomonospora sp. S1-112]|uniref:Probable endolytic peptidoglycan transglycosylase RlpA n=1 Tax=Streptomonospora mangrovi TaxID=2883123 RepID=A0A9X3NJY1_9ACTN|nr:septal ring lytic transglycosylase RlpA family protein [Streptomonospora mangrovi]MDA0563446.1 septal ring lytic transglycosylase RlpA family protein [Streptomonospora mangrovi]